MQSLDTVTLHKTTIWVPVILGLTPLPHFHHHDFLLDGLLAPGFEAPGLRMQIRRPQLPGQGLARLRFVSACLVVQARLRSFQLCQAASLSWNFAFPSLLHTLFD